MRADGSIALAADDGIYVFESERERQRVVDRPVDWVTWARAGDLLIYGHDGAAFALTDTAEPQRLTRRGVDVFPLLSFAVVP